MSKHLAYRIKERRQSLGFNQEELADLTHLTQSQISRYERGESAPTPDGLVTLARVLNTSADYLLGISDVVTSVTESDLSEFEQEIVMLMRSKSPEAQQKLIDIAKVV